MKLRYLSDILLEFIKPNKIANFIKKVTPNRDEICILAGDIGNPYSQAYDIFMTHINASFKRTFVIPGNHEYYQMSHSMDETRQYMREYFVKFPNIRLLDNDFELYENHCFIGTTLWSKITNPAYEINDVYNIPNFDYLKYNRLNTLARDFLEDTVTNHENCIVITHHIPSNDLIDPKYKTAKMLPYNQWFYCDMDDFIGANREKIRCWIYGHTHIPGFNTLHGIPFLCNPIGYPNENPKPDFACVFEVL